MVFTHIDLEASEQRLELAQAVVEASTAHHCKLGGRLAEAGALHPHVPAPQLAKRLRSGIAHCAGEESEEVEGVHEGCARDIETYYYKHPTDNTQTLGNSAVMWFV